MQTIRECPFCGYKAKIKRYTDFPLMRGGITYVVECYLCGASTNHCIDEQEAINLWNRRIQDETN